MLRTLNFTGRRKIPREAAQITLHREADGGVTFEADLRLDDFEFPTHAQIFVEAFFKTNTERFAWGTVGERQVPADRRLRRLGAAGVGPLSPEDC